MAFQWVQHVALIMKARRLQVVLLKKYYVVVVDDQMSYFQNYTIFFLLFNTIVSHC